MKLYAQKIILLPALLFTVNNLAAQTKHLSLQEALQMASKGNRRLQMQWLESRKAAAAVKEAKSFLLPTILANASYNVYAERPVIYLRNENGASKLNDVKYGGSFAFDGSLAASYPLFHPTLRSDVKLAGINEQISKEEIKSIEEKLALDISQLYLTILLNKEQVLVLRQSRQRNERALKDSRSLFLQGKNLKTDTLSNYIAVQNLKASLSALENNIHVMSVQIKHLMGIDDSMHFIFTDSLSVTHAENSLPVSNAGLSMALHNRKDVKVQSLLINQGKEQLQKEKAANKPRLWAVAQYQVQTQSDDLKIWGYGFPRTSYAGIKLSVPIYTGKRSNYKIAQSDLFIKQKEVELAELKGTIQTELISLNANLQEAWNQWQIQQQNVDAARINYTMMTDRYQYGLGNRLELTDAELALTRAKLDQLQATYAIRQAELQLKRAMGILQLN